MFDSVWTEITSFFTPERFQTLVVVVVVIVVGMAAIKILNTIAGRVTRRNVSQQYKMLIRKGIRYTGSVILLFIVLHLLGVKITALLGAAGIVGIAIGFGAFVLRLVRLGRALQPSDGEPSQPSQDDGSTGRE